MKRSAPMKRTGFKRKPDSPFSSFANRAMAQRRSTLKSRVKKPTVAEGSKYLAACRGEPCFLRMRGCLGGGDTVVPCHSNQAKHGKGMGIKAKHEFTVPGCANCHALIDQGTGLREFKFAAWDVAFEAWLPVRARKMVLQEVIA
ncbi:hypothetical protein LMG27952_03126 [Paraburkholderia hiiakae]|uniref:DUF1364 family protein n=2 Tax=Paraburkholderia hiiakae TaxID=1081782 RepID=A0ABN7HTD1_9BURK|nr:hypothetical protein LMG27952_03126 [Paraburkholderia hiiakae]